jgi:hypothetical protein
MKEARKLLKSSPHFKQWLKDNETWFMQHPESARKLIDHPQFLAQFGEALAQKRSRLEKRLARLEKKRLAQQSALNQTLPQQTKRKRSLFGLPKLSRTGLISALSKTTSAIQSVSSMMDQIDMLQNMLKLKK